MNYSTITKHLPTICTVIGVIGVPITGYLSGKAAVKADRKLNHAEELSWKEKIKQTWKYYIPPIISGSVTMASVVASNRLSKREVAALSAAVAYMTHSRDKMERAIQERYGDAVLEEIRQEAMKEVYSPKSVEETGLGETLCFEAYSGRWFRSSPEKVDEALQAFRKDYFENGWSLSLNDLYEKLGIETTHFGWQMGWPASNEYDCWYDDITFDTGMYDGFEKCGEEVYVIELGNYSYPMPDWYEI